MHMFNREKDGEFLKKKKFNVYPRWLFEDDLSVMVLFLWEIYSTKVCHKKHNNTWMLEVEEARTRAGTVEKNGKCYFISNIAFSSQKSPSVGIEYSVPGIRKKNLSASGWGSFILIEFFDKI